MPRARTEQYMQTAAATEEASGCLSFMVIPPAAVLIVSVFLATLAWRQPVTIPPADAADAVMALQPEEIQPLAASAAAGNSQTAASAPGTTSGISVIFRPEVQYWAKSIARWSAAYHLDPNLAAVVMQIESCGDPRATSRSGAIGLFQVMPFHFYSNDSPYDPDTNAARGLAYLVRSLAAAGGDTRLALAGYNGGIGVIGRTEWFWSAQTKRYVQYGVPIYEDARSGASSSAMLNEWYGRYGASLCKKAKERLGLP